MCRPNCDTKSWKAKVSVLYPCEGHYFASSSIAISSARVWYCFWIVLDCLVQLVECARHSIIRRPILHMQWSWSTMLISGNPIVICCFRLTRKSSLSYIILLAPDFEITRWAYSPPNSANPKVSPCFTMFHHVSPCFIPSADFAILVPVIPCPCWAWRQVVVSSWLVVTLMGARSGLEDLGNRWIGSQFDVPSLAG